MAVSSDRIVYGLRKAGARVDVLFLDRRLRQPYPRIEQRRGGSDILCPTTRDPGHDLQLVWLTLEKLFRDEKPDGVVAFGGTLPLTAGPPFAAWLNATLMTLLRGNDFDVGMLHPRRMDIVHRALERSAGIAVVSQEMGRRVAALFSGPRVEWIPNGIDANEWKPLPSEVERAQRWRREVVGERRVLGILGQIKPKKGVRFFLDALMKTDPSAWHVAFTGEIDDEIMAWLTKYGPAVSHSLEPFGDRYDLIWRYLAADMVAIPSFYDGLPNVLLEAAALQRPLLASTAGGMADVLVDNQHGILFNAGDAADCRRAIRRATDLSPRDLLEAGEACQRLVKEELTAERETERYLRFFSSVL